ncbi:hypothetical protein [Acinetobacter sp. YH01026]|uniref:hypothetical protein n=1 Tax=Acinetobacter sp. YH01026 TaxID=2601039 RepID=UPI0015D45C25|nr:hypothetical protein [Acinetobacter sp. YH01026]
MSVVSRSVKHSSNYSQNTQGLIIAKVAGSIKKLGQQYQDATVVLYNKANLLPIAIRKPDKNGNYQFLGLNTDLKTFIVAFDKKQQFNAVIQDNVVPK